jgi:hypothetical protein
LEFISMKAFIPTAVNRIASASLVKNQSSRVFLKKYLIESFTSKIAGNVLALGEDAGFWN